MYKNTLCWDAEYCQPNERHMGLVSAALKVNGKDHDYWLADGTDTVKLTKVFKYAQTEKRTIVCYNADAEARCFVALGLNPLDYNWIDLYADHKQLANKDNRFKFGRFVDTTGPWGPRVLQSRAMRRDKGQYLDKRELERMQTQYKKEADHKGFSTQAISPSLMNALAKFTDIPDKDLVAGMKEKIETRDIILSKPNRDYTDAEKAQILKYGSHDTAELETLLLAMHDALKLASGGTDEEVLAARLWRGRVAAAMAMVASNGTPISRERLLNLASNAEEVTNLAKFTCNQTLQKPLFQWSREGKMTNTLHLERYSCKNYVFYEHIDSLGPVVSKVFPKTDNGTYSMSKDDLKNYKDDKFISEMLKAKKIEACMGYHNPKKLKQGKRSTITSMGADDDRSRCSLFPFSTQTGRNAPKATEYIYAQSSFMKSLIEIPKGKVFVETDYSSQEFFIGAALAGDVAMMEAYKTDVYVSFAKAAGLYPKEFDKLSVAETKKKGDPGIRNRTKAVVLSLSYGASVASIAINTGLELSFVTRLVAKYKATYPKYYAWREAIWTKHCNSKRPLTLRHSGWYLGKDNVSKLSTQNMPVQGTAATILHKAVVAALEANVEIVNTLHDALYYIVDEDKVDEVIALMEDVMLKASLDAVGVEGMKLETEYWTAGERVIVPKGRADYETFKQYIETIK